MTTEYELPFYNNGVRLLAGMDEVGRGPLAGPVVACAVILPMDTVLASTQYAADPPGAIIGVDDSKKLTEKKRERLYALLSEAAITLGIGVVGHEIIDEINILQATYLAMAEAVNRLHPPPEHVLIDGNPVTGLAVPHTAIVKGDSKSFLIASASIIAKVTRDRMMHDWHRQYPEYNFAANKGYGTKEHITAIRKHGLTPIHRRSFCRKLVEEYEPQG